MKPLISFAIALTLLSSAAIGQRYDNDNRSFSQQERNYNQDRQCQYRHGPYAPVPGSRHIETSSHHRWSDARIIYEKNNFSRSEIIPGK